MIKKIIIKKKKNNKIKKKQRNKIIFKSVRFICRSKEKTEESYKKHKKHIKNGETNTKNVIEEKKNGIIINEIVELLS